MEHPTDVPEAEAEDLGRAYETLVPPGAWEVDGAAPTPPSDQTEPEQAQPPLRIIEALLFIGGAPLTAARAGEIIRGLGAEQFQELIGTLNHAYRRQGRPYAISAQASGYVLTLRPRFRSVTERLYGAAREARLSPVAVDVLALVAYRQPATKQEIDSLRGAESGSLLRQLVRRGLVAVVQRAEAGQREVFYGTTPRFLEFFGLRNLEDLPRTQDLQQI